MTAGTRHLTVPSIQYAAGISSLNTLPLIQNRVKEKEKSSLIWSSSSRNSSLFMVVRSDFLLRSTRKEVLLVVLYRLIETGWPQGGTGKFRISISINQFSIILLGVMQIFFSSYKEQAALKIKGRDGGLGGTTRYCISVLIN